MKIRFTLLAILFFVLPGSKVFAQFTDIQKDSISYMYHQGIIDGYEDATFRPAANINRAELIKLLMISSQVTPPEGNNCFTDVTGEGWYVNWVCAAKEKGWVSGYPDGTFKPANTVNKAEAAKIIVNVLGIPTYESEDTSAYAFADVPGQSWFFPYVNTLSGYYYIDWSKTFAPDRPITREEVAEVIFRNMLTQKLYAPLKAQDVFATRSYDQKTLSPAESLAIAARDFFRSTAIIETMTLDQLTQAQESVIQYYETIKNTYATSTFDFEEWNYKVMTSDGSFTYGVLAVNDPEREMTGYWRDNFDTWAILKFETSSGKLLAYDFFTRNVDRPSLYPNIVSVKDDLITLALGLGGPDPALMAKDGDHLTFQLRDMR